VGGLILFTTGRTGMLCLCNFSYAFSVGGGGAVKVSFGLNFAFFIL